jgi:hypothetical protein
MLSNTPSTSVFTPPPTIPPPRVSSGPIILPPTAYLTLRRLSAQVNEAEEGTYEKNKTFMAIATERWTMMMTIINRRRFLLSGYEEYESERRLERRGGGLTPARIGYTLSHLEED